jgi:CubicO group peptidase (beta-lactamase class C family)
MTMKREIPMTRLMITAVIFSLAAILTTLVPINAEATPPRASTEFDVIDDYVGDRLDDLRMPGAALGIVKDGEVVHLQTFGNADDHGNAVTVETPFKIGSLSKSFTALAVMQLVEAGKIQLDAPVQRYLPEFRVADLEASKRITVRHLVNQVSGIPTSAGMDYMYRTDRADDALEREVAKSSDVKLTYDPGARWQYSNRNYTTLGLIVKVASGQSYEEYIQEHVLGPLAMKQSFMHLDEAKSHGLATGHQYWFGWPVPGGGLSENRAITPTGLITASIEDMSSWLIVNLNHGVYNGTPVLSASGIDQLHAGVAPMTDKARYAMGWWETDIEGAPIVTHNGDTGESHSTMVISPSTGWGVVLLMNGSNGQARLDIPAYGVMAQLVGVPAPEMPSSFTEFSTRISLAILVILMVQIAAAWRSIIVVRRWMTNPSRRPRTLARKIIRLGVPGLLNLLWAYVCAAVLPNVLTIPFEALSLMDFGVLTLLSLAIAVFWGMIIKPAIGIWALRRSSGPPSQQDAAEPKVPIAAGVG